VVGLRKNQQMYRLGIDFAGTYRILNDCGKGQDQKQWNHYFFQFLIACRSLIWRQRDLLGH
jgi:hypothetical protein